VRLLPNISLMGRVWKSLLWRAVINLDLYLVMASLIMSATMLIVGNLLADLLLKAVEPRIKLEDLK
jgi:peptide/nickel transport system permease protein